MRRFAPRVRRTRRGDFELRIPEVERRILRSLPGQLREVLSADDPARDRLFPPAYADDAEADAEYRSLMQDDLVRGKLSAVQVMEATIDAARVDEDQLAAWLGALNDLRLVLGSRLDVTEDLDIEAIPDEHPHAAAYALYGYLTWIQAQIIDALSEGIDPAGLERR